MNTKSNQILLGVILLLAGLLSLFQNILKINYGDILLLVCGFAFLLLYRTKRKSWSLILGAYLSCFGVMSIKIGGYSLISFSPAVFFIIPAIIFLVLFFDKNKQGLLLPGAILLWFGIYLMLLNLLDRNPFALFFFCMGFAFFMAAYFGRDFLGKWVIYTCVIFAAFGTSSLLGGIRIGPVFKMIPTLGSFAIILISVFIIIRAIRNKQ